MASKASVVLLFSVCFSCIISDISSYKILGVFPFAAPSHYFLGNELIKGLAKAGHDATILTVFEEKHPPNEHYKQIFMDGSYEKQMELFGQLLNISHDTSKNFFSNPFKNVLKFFQILDTITEMTLSHGKTQTLINSKEKYDIVIVTQFGFEALKALAPQLGAHLVIFSNHGGISWINSFVGIPSLPSLNAEAILGFTGKMTFQQRVINTLFSIVQYLNFNGLVYPHHTKMVQKYISEDLDLNKILFNVSLVLSNGHTSLNKAAASVPCVKDIGGFHVKPAKKLPHELQKYLDDAKDGVIYFSMGSNVKSTDLPLEVRNVLLKVFSKRKEKILWKFEESNLPGKPANVKIDKWFPQSDLLAHPNIKLFITHGGFLSTIETVYHGVPTIAIPLLGDQLKNAKQSEADGYCKVLDLKTLNENIFASTIDELITNNKYRDNVKTRSKIFHDRQVKPMDEAVYWVEYIVRYNGADHLKVGYIDLAWYEFYLLDVFGFIFGVLFVVLFVIKKTVCFVLRKICKSSNKNRNQKKKKE